MIVLASDEGGVGMQPAVSCLNQGCSAIDAVQRGIEAVEADPSVRTVGRGGSPNMLGVLECDAAIMDGNTLQTGAVGALQGFLHAISVARSVMEHLPYVMLVGAGAHRYAREINAHSTDMCAPQTDEEYRAWVQKRIHPQSCSEWQNGPLAEYTWPRRGDRTRGTVIFLVQDTDGTITAGSSTSGWAYKYPGRIGDTPIIGAGIYADSRYGACGCTHTGEMAIRCAAAYSVVRSMRYGASVEDACRDTAEDLIALRGGFLGPVVLHAIDRNGEPYVLSVKKKTPATYWMWTGESSEIRRLSSHM